MASDPILHGVIHGKTIELAADPGMREGQTVEVTVRPTPLTSNSGDGLRRSAGALADSWNSEDDAILDQLEQDRARSLSRELPS